jgi:proteinaceous RNase P
VTISLAFSLDSSSSSVRDAPEVDMPLDEETRGRIESGAEDDLAKSARDDAAKRKRGRDDDDDDDVRRHHHHGGGGGGARAGGGVKNSGRERKSRRSDDPFGPAARARRAIDGACQRDEFDAAMTAFEEAKREESFTLAQHSCNVLLHMCAGGVGAWTNGLAPGECVREGRAGEIEAYMKERGVVMNEMTYTALARVKAASGDVDGALAAVEEMQKAKFTPKVRSYSCALHACARSGDVVKMAHVDGLMRACGLLPTELEFMAMLRAYRVAEDFDGGFGMLRQMRTEIRSPSDEMSEELRAWFNTAPGWIVADEATVDDDGAGVAVLAMDEKRVEFQLAAISLTEEERADLLAGIAKLACEREAQAEFDMFTKWLDTKKDGMNAIVDGANVGMYNQNFSKSGMNFSQVEKVLDELRKRRREGDAPPMAFLHQRRVESGPARKPQNQNLLEKWDSAGELFTTAHGSNDDWYWLYAAVHGGDSVYLVTNDECRDHVFQMLPAPKLFYRWKERHQVRFDISAGAVELFFPPTFTTCMQEAPDGSWWAFPQEDESWLCACKTE